MKQIIEGLAEIKAKIESSWKLLRLDETESEIKALEWQAGQPDFWNDTTKAGQVSRRLGDLKEFHGVWSSLRSEVGDALDYAALAAGELDDSGTEGELSAKLTELGSRFAKLEFSTLMSGNHDAGDAILAVHAGAGGTDAQDWAEMLLRMFMRYAERKGWKVRMLDQSRGQEAGVKSAVFSVEGRYAYGHLKCEAGVHRLVRLSPFNSDQLRQTSFALLEVLPDLGDVEEVKIDPKDLRIDTFLSSGHGGQGVQTTYSAVRVTHLPTGIVVTCQNERSQTQNKETAMRILRAKLHAIRLEERETEKKKLRGEHHSAEWGNQIRSYVLHPYQMVKDHRTKHETPDTEGVLDGDLDDFVEAYLRHLKAESS